MSYQETLGGLMFFAVLPNRVDVLNLPPASQVRPSLLLRGTSMQEVGETRRKRPERGGKLYDINLHVCLYVTCVAY